MKKDKYGTLIGKSRAAPYGYGLCSVCNHPNVFLNARGQIGEHGAIEIGDRCPGSHSAPANVGGKSVYLLLTQMSRDSARPNWHETFCFLAPTAKQAESDVLSWFKHNGLTYNPEDVLVRLVPPGQVSAEDLHDDWIPR